MKLGLWRDDILNVCRVESTFLTVLTSITHFGLFQSEKYMVRVVMSVHPGTKCTVGYSGLHAIFYGARQAKFEELAAFKAIFGRHAPGYIEPNITRKIVHTSTLILKK